MLRALYDYGRTHPDILTTPGCAPRTVKYIVDLDMYGNFVAVRRSDVTRVICPDVGGATRGNGSVSNVLIEKASIALHFDSGLSGDALARMESKRTCFVDYFRDGVSKIHAFRAVVRMYDDDAIFNAAYDAAVRLGVKFGDVIGFAVGGLLLSDMPAVRDWWAEYIQSDDVTTVTPDVLDIVTGEPCVPARLFKPMPVSAAGGGQSSGPILVCFNRASFESYGMKNGRCRNVPMSQKTADIIADSITYLGMHGAKLGSTKFVHWYDHDVPVESDLLDFGLFDIGAAEQDDSGENINPDAMNAMANQLVRSPLTGACPVDLAGRAYHILIMSPARSRIVIRRYMTGSYESLHLNFKAWFDDLRLVSADGTGLIPPRSMNKMLYALLSAGELKSNSGDKMAPLSPFMGPVLTACIENQTVPDAIAMRALNANTARIYAQGSASPVAMQWVKLWLCRKLRARKEQLDIMFELSDVKNPAYHCGRLMAIYERVQMTVMPDVGAGVLTKFYSACSQSPALVLGNMQAMSVHHFDKMESPAYARLLSSELEDAWTKIPGDIPKSLTLEDRAYFALGYWHGRAALSKRIVEKRAAWAAKKQAKAES